MPVNLLRLPLFLANSRDLRALLHRANVARLVRESSDASERKARLIPMLLSRYHNYGQGVSSNETVESRRYYCCARDIFFSPSGILTRLPTCSRSQRKSLNGCYTAAYRAPHSPIHLGGPSPSSFPLRKTNVSMHLLSSQSLWRRRFLAVSADVNSCPNSRTKNCETRRIVGGC